MSTKKCPCGNGLMDLKTREKKTLFKGMNLTIESEAYVCPCCGIEAGTVCQGSALQIAISEAYREKKELLTGARIKELRECAGFSREQLGNMLGVCSDTVKGWESGLVQTRDTDTALRNFLG